MSAEPYQFEEYISSDRGLMARPVMPNNAIAYQGDILSINYEIFDVTGGISAPLASGSLVVADVMFTTLQTWDVDAIGYTFLWQAPGSLWPLPDKEYRIKLTFQTTVALGSKNFIRTWQVSSKDPAAA